METPEKKQIPKEYLPEDWCERVANEFDLSKATVWKVATGERNNTKVFDRLLELAEEGKQAELQRIERLENLTKPIEA